MGLRATVEKALGIAALLFTMVQIATKVYHCWLLSMFRMVDGMQLMQASWVVLQLYLSRQMEKTPLHSWDTCPAKTLGICEVCHLPHHHLGWLLGFDDDLLPFKSSAPSVTSESNVGFAQLAVGIYNGRCRIFCWAYTCSQQRDVRFAVLDATTVFQLSHARIPWIEEDIKFFKEAVEHPWCFSSVLLVVPRRDLLHDTQPLTWS